MGAAGTTTLTIAFVFVGAGAATFALYLLALSIAACLCSGSRDRRIPPRTRLVVLVPAHNEAALIARCVRSLRAQTYPRELYQVVVVADNCTDRTAAIAAEAGADQVLTRDEPQLRGKGHALRWAMDRLLVSEPVPDAVAVVDADSVADPGFLTALVQPLQAGAVAVQGESLLSADGGTNGQDLAVIAFLLVNRVRPAGRAALGLPATHLAGNGMLIARELLLAKPWMAFTSAEDLEYSLALQLAGVTIAFAGGAIVHSPPAPNPRAAAHQQLRWHGGKAHLARTWIPRLLIRAVLDRRPSLLAPAFDLAVPPLALLATGVTAGSALGAVLVLTGISPAWNLIPWLVAFGSIPLYVLIGLRAAGAPASGYRAMASAPLFIVRVALRAHRLVRFRGDVWVRTERQEL